MKKQYICENHCEQKAIAKIIWNKQTKKEYSIKKASYYCRECLEDLVCCVWSGGDTFFSDTDKIINLHRCL